MEETSHKYKKDVKRGYKHSRAGTNHQWSSSGFSDSRTGRGFSGGGSGGGGGRS